ncbi:Recombination factor protein RarA, partial [human gut metagenome]
LNGALLSRCQVLVLHRLSDQAQAELIERAEKLSGRRLPLTQQARQALVAMADGDGRYLLGMVEQLLGLAPHPGQDRDEPLAVAGL